MEIPQQTREFMLCILHASCPGWRCWGWTRRRRHRLQLRRWRWLAAVCTLSHRWRWCWEPCRVGGWCWSRRRPRSRYAGVIPIPGPLQKLGKFVRSPECRVQMYWTTIRVLLVGVCLLHLSVLSLLNLCRLAFGLFSFTVFPCLWP